MDFDIKLGNDVETLSAKPFVSILALKYLNMFPRCNMQMVKEYIDAQLSPLCVEINKGMMDSCLKRMETMGFLKSKVDNNERGYRVINYELTVEGRKRLRQDIKTLQLVYELIAARVG